MAQCHQSAVEFIRDAYAPMVAVFASQDAERICRKNHLSFTELIQPFCRLASEGQIRDPNNLPHSLQQLSICVRDLNVAPPNPAMARKLMGQAVASCQPSNGEGARNSVVSVGDYDLQLTACTPWYEAYRDCFFHLAQPSDHEFIKHFLACLFVVSSAHADVMDQFSRMTSQQFNLQFPQANPPPRWFCPNVFRYYVLLHDISSGDLNKAEATYNTMKSTYGANSCHLLQVNSRSPSASDSEGDGLNLPDPWSQFLARTDYMRNAAFDKESSLGMDGVDVDVPSLENVESATEATEENEVPSQSSIMIDHPLAPDSGSLSPMSEGDGQSGLRDGAGLSSKELHKAGSHGQCLLLSDHDRIRIFIQEFLTRGLLPWAERTLRTLNDQLTSRKGIHRSLFSATKKWFGGNKQGAPSPTTEKANVVYTSEAPEMQMRRMADLAFMFQLYDLAYQTYHTAKRDFNNDHAWLYYAGALEMACISVFMQGPSNQRQYPQHYMESAVSTYLNTCKNPQFATRATMLSTEALKSRGLYMEAALQLIKMTSELGMFVKVSETALADRNAPWRPGYGQNQEAVDSDLRSALLLEQAGHCFINMKQPMVRKFAFHMILAGHRYSKAGQRKHALRSYAQSLQVYKGKSWTLAEDHINFTIGRQSFNLRQLDNATAAFKHVLTVNSRQSPLQQNAFLREYLFVYKQQLSQMTIDGTGMCLDQLPQLPLPCVDGNSTKVLLGSLEEPEVDSQERGCSGSASFDNAECDLDKWKRLEELLVTSEGNSLPVHFRPSLPCATNRTHNAANPVAVVGEPVTVQVSVSNPLRIPLILTDVVLLWKFVPSASNPGDGEDTVGQDITNEIASAKNKIADELVESQVIDEVTLSANQEQPLQLQLTPLHTGELHITGLAYNLGSSSQNAAQPATNPTTGKPSFVSTICVRGKVPLEVQGPRLNNTKQEKASKSYGPDRRLDLVVVPSMPRLQVQFHGFPRSMLCGEVRQITVSLENHGPFPLHRLQVASTDPDFFTFGVHPSHTDSTSCYPTIPNSADHDSEEYPIAVDTVKHVTPILLQDGMLKPKDCLQLPVWIRGLDRPGTHQIDFLFYYEAPEKHSKLKYRVLRHSATLELRSSVGLKAVATRGSACQSSPRQADPISISLEVENLQQASVSDVSLLQVSCASRSWHLHHLSTKRHSDIKVNPQESILMTFKAHRCHTQGDKGHKVFTNVTFDQHQIHSAVTPCADFYFRASSAPPLSEVAPSHSSTHHFAKQQKTTLPAIQDLDEALRVGLTLIVLWKASLVDDNGDSHMITGQHHVTLDTIHMPVYSPPLAKAQVEQQPVKIISDPEQEDQKGPGPELLCQLLRFTFAYKQMVTHDFTKGRVVCVPIRMQLHNCCKCSVCVDINPSPNHSMTEKSKVDLGSRPPLALPTNPFLDSPSHAFFWSGCTQTQLELLGNGSRELSMLACFSQPGVYNLATLSILARPSEGPNHGGVLAVPQRPTAASLIIIQNAH